MAGYTDATYNAFFIIVPFFALIPVYYALYNANPWLLLIPTLTGALSPLAHFALFRARVPASDATPYIFLNWLVYMAGCLAGRYIQSSVNELT